MACSRATFSRSWDATAPTPNATRGPSEKRSGAVLSDNNDVVLADGREFEGTWRWWGGEIADFLNAGLGTNTFNYMDFYMCGAAGSGPWDEEAWLAGVRLVFRRLLQTGASWRSCSSYPSVVEIYEAVAREGPHRET